MSHDIEKGKQSLSALSALENQMRNLIPIDPDNDLANSRFDNTTCRQVVYNPITVFQLCMPHSTESKNKRQEDDKKIFTVRNGEANVFFKRDEYEFPCQYLARFMLLWVRYHVQRTGDMNIYLGSSVSDLLTKIGGWDNRPRSKYIHVNKYFPALFDGEIKFKRYIPEYDAGESVTLPYQGSGEDCEYFRIANRFTGIGDKENKDKRAMRVYVSEEFRKLCIKHPLLLDIEKAKELAVNGGSYRLDIYTFITEVLHKIPEDNPLFIERVDIEDLFGHGVKDKTKFYNDTFIQVLKEVIKTAYPQAQIDTENTKKGLTLYHSPPPVPLEHFPLLAQLEQKELR